MTLISTLVILFMSGIIILLLYNYNNTPELKAIYENALEKYEMENSDEKILKEEPYKWKLWWCYRAVRKTQ